LLLVGLFGMLMILPGPLKRWLGKLKPACQGILGIRGKRLTDRLGKRGEYTRFRVLVYFIQIKGCVQGSDRKFCIFGQNHT
jgi:hypothetical protein